MNRTTAAQGLAGMLGGALALVLAAPALAQTAPADAAAAAADEDADGEAIIVTGSRIRGIAPVGSNVISISADRIAQEPVDRKSVV